MAAIYKRELRSFFHTVVGWLFVAVVMFLTGVYFLSINLLSGYSSIANTVASAIFVYILTIPFLTMRILSEERKQKIDQLILTAPISVGKIVIGKYLAMCTVFMIPILVTACYPLILSAFGTVPFGESYTAVLGFALYGLTAIAMGLWISSVTENQIIAAVLTFVAMFVTYMMAGICSLITSAENVVTTFIATVLGVFDFTTRFDLLLNGQLDMSAVVYYLTMIVMFLFLTSQSVLKRRYTVSAKNLKVGAYSFSMIVVSIVAAVFINLMVGELPDRFTKFDVTSDRLYSLTDETKEFLETINEDVTIYVLCDEADEDMVLGGALDQYAEASKHITIEYKDPVKTPTFYRQYTTDNSITMNSLIVESEKRYRVINYSDIYEYEIDYTTYSQNLTGYDGEGLLTSAISYVLSDDMPNAYVITGHDEFGIDTSFMEAIEKQNITLSELNLMTAESVPEDAEFLLIAAPGSDYSKDDADKVIEYVENGGQLLVTTVVTESVAETLPNFQTILDCFNTTITDGLIVENNSNYYYGDPTYLLPEVMSTYLTDGVYGKKYVFASYSQGIVVTEDETTSYTSILGTSAGAYSKIDIANAQTYEKTEGDIEGPFMIGVSVQKTYDDKTAKMILFTSCNMFTDSADSMVANANLTIFSNCLEELNDSEIETVSIPVKTLTADSLMVSVGTALLLGGTLAVIIPIILIITGIVIWYRRKKS